MNKVHVGYTLGTRWVRVEYTLGTRWVLLFMQ